jgi:hypothetical protein
MSRTDTTEVSRRLRPLVQARLRGTPIQIDGVVTLGTADAVKARISRLPGSGIVQQFLAVPARQVLVGVVAWRENVVDRAARRVVKAHLAARGGDRGCGGVGGTSRTGRGRNRTVRPRDGRSRLRRGSARGREQREDRRRQERRSEAPPPATRPLATSGRGIPLGFIGLNGRHFASHTTSSPTPFK